MMQTNNKNTENSSVGRLVAKLKNEDLFYANISKALQIVYLVFIPLFSVFTYRQYSDTQEVLVIVGGVCLLLSFLIFILFFRNYYRDYKYVDYSLPTIEMLKKAVCRYQPFQKKSVWILLALAFMDAGLSSNWMDERTTFLTTQVLFWGAMTFGVVVGIIVWYIRYKPIRDEALRLIREIEKE